ncbi:hypothetical protein XcvCFBP7112P_08135 [Xanthomonas citri pv. vignicola]|nr:hypothetical protein XcvCFBP7112P_08135 [Xanthomonas citri pv. vignicola]
MHATLSEERNRAWNARCVLACAGSCGGARVGVIAENVFLNGTPVTRGLRQFSSCASRVGLFILAHTIERRMVRP